MAEIELDSVSVIFENKAVGLDNVSLSIESGEFLFLLGKSGAGKSTLLRTLYNEIQPAKGRVLIGGVDLKTLSKKDRPIIRRRFGIIQQKPMLLPDKTIAENIAFALIVTEQPEETIEPSVNAALGIVGMKKKAGFKPEELSGGELFRAGLARALVNNPQIIVADEPTASLDSGMAWDIMGIFSEINRLGKTVIIATHAKDLVNLMRKRVVTLYHGRLMGDVEKGRYGDIV